MSDDEKRKEVFSEVKLVWDELAALKIPRETYLLDLWSLEKLTAEVEERRDQLKRRKKFLNIED